MLDTSENCTRVKRITYKKAYTYFLHFILSLYSLFHFNTNIQQEESARERALCQLTECF